MDHEPPTPFDTVGDQPVEARIVAWVLGESSAFEAAELERLCEERPELLVFRRRMRALHGLLTEAEASEADHSWKLPPEKRKLLDEIFGEEKVVKLELEKERDIRRSGRRAILAIAACLMLALVITRLIPWKYESEAIIEIKSRSSMDLGFDKTKGEKSQDPKMTAEFFGTEFEKIKSSNSLGKVVDKLALTDRWKVDKEDAIKILKDSVKPQNIRGTDLISIRVKNANEQDAKEIAHEVALAYKDYRTEIDQRDTNKELYELNKAVRDQEDKVEERRKVLATIVRTKGIIYKGQDSFYGASGVDEDQAARGALQTYNDLQTQKMQMESQINSLLKYDNDELLQYASGLDLPENAVRNLYPQYIQAKRAFGGLKIEGSGDNHPRVKAAAENIDAMKRQLDESVINLRSTLQTQLSMASDRLKNVEMMKNDTHEEAIKRGLDAQDYVDAKRDFETDQQLLQTMKLEQINKTITGKMPSDSIVIHEDPLPESSTSLSSAVVAAPASPASPAAAPVGTADGGKEMTMSLAKSKAGLAEAQQDLKRERLVTGRKTAEPAQASVADTDLPELAESSKLESAPKLPNTRGAGGFGGGIDIVGGSSFGLKADNALRDAAASADTLAKNDDAPSLSSFSRRRTDTRELESQPRAGMNLSQRFDDSTQETPLEQAEKGDFVSPVNGTSVDGIPADPDQLAANSVTNGLRSGDQAINRNSIDAILNNPNRTAGENKKSLSDEEDGPTTSSPLSLNLKAKGNYRQSKKMPTLAAKDSSEVPAKQSEVDELAGKIRPRAVPPPGQPTASRKPEGDLGDLSQRGKAVLEDPIRTNPALTAEHGENMDKVRKELYTAEGNFNLGKNDDSKKAYEEVLKTDPYNSAARRGLDKVAQAKTDYYRAAYDHTRAELLSQVDSSWELKVPTDKNAPASSIPSGGAEDGEALKRLEEGKLTGSSESAVPEIEMGNVTAGGSHPIMFGDMNLRAGSELSEFSSNLSADPEIFTEKSNLNWDSSKLGEKKPWDEDNSLYLFRGMDLGKAEDAKVNLADLMEEIPASENPYSTFSLNISDASFQLAKAAIAKGEMPDPQSVKPEQFYNAVDYGDPAPTSNEPVAATVEQSAHPIIPGRNLVRVALRTASVGRAASQPLRLTLLVDQSGSMVREDRRAAMENALKQLGGLLTKNDSVTIVGFSRTPHLLADGLAGDQSAKLGEIINQTASEGGTNLEEAMKLGAQMAERHQLAGAQNRIVLFTDGAANLGNANPERLAKQVTSLRQKGIAFDIAGIGADGLNDRLLGELARHGNGRYYVVGDARNDSFARQLAGAFRPAAENVKVQVNFNPQRVGKYKLIGFEKDRLKTEDFRNDSVDAAELAADEAGVAIYQVETLPEGTGEIGEVSVRFRDTASSEMVERSWTIPHESSATAFDRASPSMQLAGLSLLAAEKLKGGPLADAIDFKLLAGPTASVKQFYGASARVGEMLQVIEKLK
ncbi:MAG: von Willebrand factor type A domain-containing protein [Luteolibacter sp.]|uniref:YfbK domain-containing protein n=1 Tax=Luteolibacter sp. TaxID=1962973 RepID=UPI003265E7FD